MGWKRAGMAAGAWLSQKGGDWWRISLITVGTSAAAGLVIGVGGWIKSKFFDHEAGDQKKKILATREINADTEMTLAEMQEMATVAERGGKSWTGRHLEEQQQNASRQHQH